MNKETFLVQLREQLSEFPAAEIETTLSFYAEDIADRMEDGMSEEEAVASLGSVEHIATEILVELPLSTMISNKVKESHQKSKHKVIWIILAICGFPVWFFLLIAILATIVSVYASVWATILSLVAIQLSLLVLGIMGVVAGVATVFSEGVALGMMKIGIGVATLGFVVATTLPLLWLVKQFIQLTANFFKKVKQLFRSKNKEDLS